jgi:hypothetical protein
MDDKTLSTLTYGAAGSPDGWVTRLYIAGPMTGIPQFNYPAFDAASQGLRALGYDAISPAELDDPETRKAALASPDGAPGSGSANGETWADFLARDVKLISDGVDAVAVLPGWQRSRGARLETFVARLNHRPVYEIEYPEDTPEQLRLRHLDDAELDRRLGYGDPGIPGLSATKDAVVFNPQPSDPPDGEVRATDSRTGGQKGRKPQVYSLIPMRAVGKIAEVFAFGARKYAAHNWRRGYAWSWSYDALQRHLTAFWDEHEDLDEETGLPHLAAAGFHVLVLLTFLLDPKYRDLDDRYDPEA